MHRLLNTFKNHGSNHDLEKLANGHAPSPTTASSPSERSSDDEGSEFHLDQGEPEIPPDPIDDHHHIDHAELAALVAQYGHAPATAWLERARYRIWRPSEPVPSSFLPVQGYLHTGAWVFAWGSPLVSDAAALRPTVTQFIAWVQSHEWRLVYCCVSAAMEAMLADVGWSTVSCISEDVIDPRHVLELTHKDDEGGHGSMVKDLKKNLRRAERANVEVRRVLRQDWSDELRRERSRRASLHGSTLVKGSSWLPCVPLIEPFHIVLSDCQTSFDPWLDFENREYWIALQHGRVVGVLILTQAGDSYVIKNAAQFPDAPKGTSERLIYSVLRDLYEQHPEGPEDHESDHLMMTFNMSAASNLKPTRNISGWKFTWLSQTYSKIAHGAHLFNRHDFRRKFDTSAQRMFVCYPTENGFGLDGIEKLLKLLQR